MFPLLVTAASLYGKNEVENISGHVLRRLREEIDSG